MPFLLYSLDIPPQQFQSRKEECQGDRCGLLQEWVKHSAFGFSLHEIYEAWQVFECRYDTIQKQALPNYLKEEPFKTTRNNLLG